MPASVGIRGEAVAPPVHPNRRTEARASRPNRIRVSPLEGQQRENAELGAKVPRASFGEQLSRDLRNRGRTASALRWRVASGLCLMRGRGLTIRLFQLGIPLGTIESLFITHFHSDHLNGLPDYFLTSYLRTPYAVRNKEMRLAGPSTM
jgi:hypothetical protein